MGDEFVPRKRTITYPPSGHQSEIGKVETSLRRQTVGLTRPRAQSDTGRRLINYRKNNRSIDRRRSLSDPDENNFTKLLRTFGLE